MLVVGLTGGIGCGKSEVRSRLVAAGLEAIDADTLARELTNTNAGIIKAIKAEFGEDMYDGDGRLRRKALAAIVFNDRKKLEILNGIIHPRVISTVERMIGKWETAGKSMAIIEAALHYEVKWNEAMDVMVVVYASLENRIKWIMQRDGIDEAAVRRRMANQLPLEEKVRRADYVVENTGDLQQLDRAVEQLVKWLRARAA
ncbi:MAG: dephospho-CoA kinase [candidate division KSB1 bacterium]|nr:dephospho-CoA kinase [candidate division KSB1 bacterium]MDZ7273484.1 dephospho-CoA kinase [candidate division KSB1 bacterium]MDZ7286924.1 dephospho-CoA kinase [candidate division KSB1 bacterium]MDZ7299723.1 dephospho-CoA kinase [candidate division KSB1 bacterium]MDZ7305662.1 dephospho-CoA kinase [candidate division KSB1 bacterium]